MKSKTTKKKDNQLDVENETQLVPQWYVVSTTTGNEISVAKSLRAKVKSMNYEDLICDVKVIMVRREENEYYSTKDPKNYPPKVMRNSINIKWISLPGDRILKKKTIMHNKYPGYIFIKMVMTDDAWYVVRNSPNITGLVGSSGSGIKPQPISEGEIEDILNDPNILTDSSVIHVSDDSKVITDQEDMIFDDKNSELGKELKDNSDISDAPVNAESNIKNPSFVVLDDSASRITATHAAEFYAAKKSKNLQNLNKDEQNKVVNDSISTGENVLSNDLIDENDIKNVRILSEVDENLTVGNTVQIQINENEITGVVVEVDFDKKMAKIKVNILGRETVIDSSFDKIKIEK